MSNSPGLFLKTPEDEGIYGSAVMAAKVMKLEAKAAQWVHAMDSMHVNAVLTTVVDATYYRCGPHSAPRETVQRVQVQAHVALGQDTLRVGSPDGVQHTFHVDSEQEEDVVQPLADHFHLGPIGIQSNIPRGRFTVMQHEYDSAVDLEPESSDEAQGESSAGSKVAAGSAGGGADGAVDFLKALREEGGADVGIVEEAYIPCDLEDGSVEVDMLESGVNLGHEYAPSKNPHRVRRHPSRGPVMHPLPFDVEIHQLPSGERIVVDTHRLLMPDLHWLETFCGGTGDFGSPRVWAALEQPAGDEADTGSCMMLLDAVPLTSPRLASMPCQGQSAHARQRLKQLLEAEVARVCVEGNALPPDGRVTIASQHVGAGCVLLESARDEDGCKLCVVVACPRWYFGKIRALTCMMPP